MKCPACTETLADNATRCDCGWKRKGAPAENTDSLGRERYCCFMLATEERCPNLASWYAGGERRGYCRNHSRSTDIGIVGCPPEIKVKIAAFLRKSNVTRPRQPGEEG